MGDEAFTRKCLDKIGEFRRRGKTILLVTHSLGLVEKMCDEVLWLRHGQHGRPGRSQARGRRLPDLRGRAARRRCSRASTASRGERAGAAPERRPASRGRPGYREGRWGSREVEITERAPARRPRAASATSSCPARASRVALSRARARSRSRTSCSASASSPPTASASTAPTPTSRSTCRARLAGEGEVRFELEDLRLVEGTYLARRGRPPARRHALRLPPRPLLVPREEPHQGRGRLPARPPLDVQRRRRARRRPRRAPSWTSHELSDGRATSGDAVSCR